MPPEPAAIGRSAALAFFDHILGDARPGDWRLVPTSANGRPAVVNYLRAAHDDRYLAISVDVVHIRGDRIAAINCFLDRRLAAAFGQPLSVA